MNIIARKIGGWLANWLNQPTSGDGVSPPTSFDLLDRVLRPGDVVLIDGNTRFSVAIKYLTQSTWSHAALFIGDAAGRSDREGRPLCFLEVDILEGVRLVGYEEITQYHCRICRPVKLASEDTRRLIEYALSRLGQHYDLKNVMDLARYLFPMPPVPVRWRRQMLSLGSGDPTRAICSTFIAQCFQMISYPILPKVVDCQESGARHCKPGEKVLIPRHNTLIVPRDFDVSPYFEIVKPTIAVNFDYKTLRWAHTAEVGPG